MITSDEEAMDYSFEILCKNDFYFTEHKIIFEAIKELAKNSNNLDLVTLADHINMQGNLKTVGNGFYIGEIVQKVATSGNYRFYCNRIKEYSIRREAIKLCCDLSIKLSQENDIDEILGDFTGRMDKIQEINTEKTQHIRDILPGLIQDIQEKCEEQKNPEKRENLKTGLKCIDDKVTIYPGNMVIIAARPSEGKTVLACQIAINYAAFAPVLIVTYEMTKEELAERYLSAYSNIDIKKAKTKEDAIKIFNAASVLETKEIYINDQNQSIDELEYHIKRFVREHRPAAIVIDYLALIPMTKESRRYEFISDCSRRFKRLAQILKTRMIIVSQLNRETEKRANRKENEDHSRPKLSDLRDSGQIEQDADMIFFIHRDKKYDEFGEQVNDVELILAKNRNGPLFNSWLHFDREHLKFTDQKENNENINDYF